MTRISTLSFALALAALAAGAAAAMASKADSAWSPVDYNFVAQAIWAPPSRSLPAGLPKRRPPPSTSATTRTSWW